MVVPNNKRLDRWLPSSGFRLWLLIALLCCLTIISPANAADIVDPPPATPEPTVEPTVQPTLPPTPPPTFPPSPSPTTEPPTMSPSQRPTTSEPTLDPTPGPTEPPTIAPTVVASNAPSRSPSDQPSVRATFLPSESPTTSTRPSAAPSNLPTLSISPTSSPSSLPSLLPTAFPSSSPTLTEQAYDVEVVMYFNDADPFESRTIITYQDVTEFQMAEEFNEFFRNGGEENTDLRIDVDVQSQQETGLIRRGRLGRTLQQDNPLRILFKTIVVFRSAQNDIDVESLIGGAFDSDSDRALYINRLRATRDESFSTITEVRVEIDGQDVDEETDDNGGPGVNLFIIIGATLGGLALMILGYLFYCRKRPRKQPTISTTQYNQEASNPEQGLERLNTDVLVDNGQDEISTLGDPMYHPGGMAVLAAMERDEVTASIVSGDYDYAKNYGQAGPNGDANSRAEESQPTMASSSVLGALGKMDNSIFSDDSSFEQQFVEMEDRFEVVAPAGKLGMVIDTPSGGVPVVHAIKASSVLVDKVQVADRLLAVDDHDTTGLTAMQVSKLISQKADNPSRTLVFARTRARAFSTDQQP